MRLTDVRKIYIEKMENGLDNYLRSAISDKFHNRLNVVLDRGDADAILRGVNTNAQRESATVSLVDSKGKIVLWSGTASDRDIRLLGLRHGGEEQIADNLVSQMKKAMEH